MAVWRITENLAVTYLGRGQEQTLGHAEESTLADVEMWAACEAKPWDLVVSPRGNFMRQQTPARRA